MFTSGRKLEILYREVLEYAKSISNRTHAGNHVNPLKNTISKMAAVRIADFDISLERLFYLT
jgi:hypothetical protein